MKAILIDANGFTKNIELDPNTHREWKVPSNRKKIRIYTDDDINEVAVPDQEYVFYLQRVVTNTNVITGEKEHTAIYEEVFQNNIFNN